MAGDYLDVFYNIMDKISEHDKDEGVAETGIPKLGIPKTDTPEQVIDGVQVGRYHIRVDQNVFDELLPSLTTAEQAVYMRLYRLSWGFRRNWCEVGYAALVKATNASKNTVRVALNSLADKGLIDILERGLGSGVSKYLIRLPHEVMSLERQTEVIGVSNLGIPNSGIPKTDQGVSNLGIPKTDTPTANTDEHRELGGVSNLGIPKTDPITIHNNNNNIIQGDAADAVDNLVTFFGVTDATARKWIAEYGAKQVREKMEICRLHMQHEPGKIKNPPGLLSTALQEDWDYPEWFFREFAHKAGKELKR